MWIVTIIKWYMERNGRPVIFHCNSRAYRHKDYAKGRYDAVVEALESDGYSFRPLEVPAGEDYEGVQGCLRQDRNEGHSTLYATVYIDRNP